MNRTQSSLRPYSALLRFALMAVIVFVCAVGVASSATTHWWDAHIPRFVQDPGLATVQSYPGNLAGNGVGNDPGWGLWFSYNSNSSWNALRQTFDAAGIPSINYMEGFGTSTTPIVSYTGTAPATITYSVGTGSSIMATDTIVWAGDWTWFDDAYAPFARPYTCTNPTYGGQPMTYPNGTVATGWKNGDSSSPLNSYVYDAGCACNILGTVTTETYSYITPGTNHAGCFYDTPNKQWVSNVSFDKDAACPCWNNYYQASTQFEVAQTGVEGTWTDNMSAYNSFSSDGGPLYLGFGKWSVALFNTYLQNNFTVAQLISMGVLTSGQTYANLSSFSVATYMQNEAKSAYGWNGSSLTSSAWTNTAWNNDPVWCAYKIFKRQNGTAALAARVAAYKAGAAAAGQPDFFVMGNDQEPSLFGWQRGSCDMSSTEMMLSGYTPTDSRGPTLPPYARLSPFYKMAREFSNSRFVNVWLYNNGYVNQSKVPNVINAGVLRDACYAHYTNVLPEQHHDVWGTDHRQSFRGVHRERDGP